MNKTKFKGNWNLCGKYGHKAADIWTKDENQDKRPKVYKFPKQETGMANTNEDSNDGTEFMLMVGQKTFGMSESILKYLNVFISDTVPQAIAHHIW